MAGELILVLLLVMGGSGGQGDWKEKGDNLLTMGLL